MKNLPRTYLAITIATFFSLSVAFFPQVAHALEVTVNPSGAIYFFDDGVLGTNTELAQVQRQASKIVPSRAGNRIRLQATDQAVQVGVENEQNNAVQSVDQDETQRLRAQFPAQVTEVHMQNLRADDKLEQRTEYQQRLLEERKDRTDNVEVRSKLNDNGAQELEVRSKSATAQIRRAEFAVEPETNTVTITTPSGEERVLNHLPDQALERIRQRVALQNDETANPEFTIETNDQGQIIYRANGVKRKKFLGLFERGIEAEVVLNDETGEVREEEKPSPGVLGQFLDAFTF